MLYSTLSLDVMYVLFSLSIVQGAYTEQAANAN